LFIKELRLIQFESCYSVTYILIYLFYLKNDTRDKNNEQTSTGQDAQAQRTLTAASEKTQHTENSSRGAS